MDFKEACINSISVKDQRVFIKMCMLLNHSSGIIHQSLTKALGDKALPKSTVERWMAKFRKGEFDVEEHRGGDRSDKDVKAERIEMVRNCFDEERHWSLRSLASRLNIPKSTLAAIVKDDLKMKKVLGKWVPRQLTEEQRQLRVFAARTNLTIYNKTKEILKRTVSIDETWVSLYMEPDRHQARAWHFPGEPVEQIPAQNIHGEKRMLIMAMSSDGIAFWELLPEKTTVNGQIYRDFLKRHLRKWLGSRRIDLLWLHHDNARPHKHQMVREFIEENKINLWNQPPYSPDISPLDYGCFALLKRKLRGIRHSNWNDFEKALTTAAKELNQSGQMDAIQRLPARWERVIKADGVYI